MCMRLCMPFCVFLFVLHYNISAFGWTSVYCVYNSIIEWRLAFTSMLLIFSLTNTQTHRHNTCMPVNWTYAFIFLDVLCAMIHVAPPIQYFFLFLIFFLHYFNLPSLLNLSCLFFFLFGLLFGYMYSIQEEQIYFTYLKI